MKKKELGESKTSSTFLIFDLQTYKHIMKI